MRHAQPLLRVAAAGCHRAVTTAASYDSIVVGLGAHGSACLYHVAKSGSKVLGLEQYGVSHTQGSHHGHTRITRQAYLEGAAYVPLLRRSFDFYHVLEDEMQQTLYHKTGCLNIGNPICSAALASAQAHGLPHELLTGDDVNKRFPGYDLPGDIPVLYEEVGGILEPERMIQAHCSVAQQHGAEVHSNEQVLSWEASPGGSGVTVVTNKGRYHAANLVLTGGAWMHKLVPELQGLSQPGRAVVAWFQTTRPQLYQPGNFPVFIMQDDATGKPFYGFPEFSTPGLKVGLFEISANVDPDSLDRRQLLPGDEAPLRSFVQRYMPAAAGDLLRSSVCMFVMTPDHHFVIDHHPKYPQVIICSACSGHGFKLSPAIGQVLAYMAVRGSPREFQEQMQQHRLDPRRPGHQPVLSRFGVTA